MELISEVVSKVRTEEPFTDVVPRLQKCKTRQGEPAGRVKRAQDLARRFADLQRGH